MGQDWSKTAGAWMGSLDADGYALLPTIFAPADVEQILTGWKTIQRHHRNGPAILDTKKGAAFAARNLLRIWPDARKIIQETVIRDYLTKSLGLQAGIVRGLFFDKPPGNSWALPWHKDYMIAVAELGTEGVFTHPTTTAGIPQVKAPQQLLQKMLTVRVHLDDMTEDNGPLRVIPGSHKFYAQAHDVVAEPVTIHCKAGDVLFMRPLLTHASRKSKEGAGHRRILHFECAPTQNLADGYAWYDFVPICELSSTSQS